jgi:RNA polymerase sigma factor (sigma-70 family)
MPPDVAALMRDHAGLLAALAPAAVRRANPHRPVTRDELVTAGAVGLWQAARRWDGRPGVRFTTYAGPWVLGAMIDWLRSESPFPRRWRNPPALKTLDDATDHAARDRLNAVDDRDAFRAMLSGLKPDERLILLLKYEAGLEISEAARAVGVCTRSGYMIHDRAVAALRMALAA